MILDAHTHICPPEIRRDRERFFPGEDDFRVLYENPAARPANRIDEAPAAPGRTLGSPPAFPTVGDPEFGAGG